MGGRGGVHQGAAQGGDVKSWPRCGPGYRGAVCGALQRLAQRAPGRSHTPSLFWHTRMRRQWPHAPCTLQRLRASVQCMLQREAVM
jgi:hypothetical protein